MARSGDLERAVMDVLWAAPGALTAREVHDRLETVREKSLAHTTVLTVLARLEAKGLLGRTREGKAHRYLPVAGRAEHTATLMQELLAGAQDRSAVLARFVGEVSSTDVATLRRVLDDLAPP